MPDEKDGQKPAGNADSQSLPPTPKTPLPKQRIVADAGASNPDQETESTQELEKEVHWITHASFWSQVGLGIIGIVALCIYYGQLKEMRHTNDLTQQALNSNGETLRQTLTKMQEQVDATNRLYTEAQRQTPQIIKQAGAARSAADTAQDTLHISERAYISTGTPSIDWAAKAIKIPLENNGHIPSGPVDILMYESTTIATDHGNEPPSYYTEAHWRHVKMATMQTGSPVSVNPAVIYFDPDQIRSGHESYQIGVTVSYNDGFPNTPPRQWETCISSFYVPQAKDLAFSPCLLSNSLEMLIKLSGYPDPRKEKIW